jgi:hypothetical protein
MGDWQNHSCFELSFLQRWHYFWPIRVIVIKITSISYLYFHWCIFKSQAFSKQIGSKSGIKQRKWRANQTERRIKIYRCLFDAGKKQIFDHRICKYITFMNVKNPQSYPYVYCIKILSRWLKTVIWIANKQNMVCQTVNKL